MMREWREERHQLREETGKITMTITEERGERTDTTITKSNRRQKPERGERKYNNAIEERGKTMTTREVTGERTDDDDNKRRESEDGNNNNKQGESKGSNDNKTEERGKTMRRQRREKDDDNNKRRERKDNNGREERETRKWKEGRQ